MAHADAFCASSTARPDELTYKAVLIDGTSRTASPFGWVMKPSTTYYQAAGVLPLVTTNSQGLYDTSQGFMNPYLNRFTDIRYMWTGVNFDIERFDHELPGMVFGVIVGVRHYSRRRRPVRDERLDRVREPEGVICVSQ